LEPEWKNNSNLFFISKICQNLKPKPWLLIDFGKKASSFEKAIEMEVMKSPKALSAEEKLIANFWDWQSLKLDSSGHMAMGV